MRTYLSHILMGLALLSFAACSDYKSAGGGDPKVKLQNDASQAIKDFRETDPSLSKFFDGAVGYVVFPSVAKGAVGIGAAHGDGVVYQRGGRIVGYASLTQGTLGVQLGGQTYSELIFFETERQFNEFKASQMEFSAQASAVAAAKGAAANADYANGVAVFSGGQKGLMFEASIGGQKFRYMPK